MALPLIFLPPELPLPLVRGHAQTIDDQFDHVPMMQGEGRKRRLYTTSNRTAQLTWLLTESQMLIWDAWFEDTLDAGQRQFTCPIAKLGPPGLVEYQTAEFISPDVDDPIASPNGLWEVSVPVLLTGEPSDTLPDTGILTLDTIVSLGGTGALIVPNAFALDTVVSLGATIGLTLDTVVSLGIIDNGAPANEDDFELRWIIQGLTYAPGFTEHITTEEQAARSYIETREL